jgi:ABC-type branched-subunit amino acid transport system substrate-binding protein
MAYEEGVWALLGSVDGASTHLAEQVVAKARLPLISAVSTDSSVNLAGVPWMFSVAPGDHLWAPVLAAHLVDTVAGRAFALIAVTDHDSRLATAALLEALDELDRAPSHRLDLAPGTVDLESRLARLNLPVLAALVLVAGPEDGARLLREVRAYGFDGEIFATPSFARRRSLEIAGTAAEGVRIPLLWQSRPEASGHHSFEDLFRQRTGVDPDWAAAYTFDATRLLLEAVGRAGLSRAGIREALVDLSPWEGITGVIEWDPTGQNRRPVIAMATVREGHPRTE